MREGKQPSGSQEMSIKRIKEILDNYPDEMKAAFLLRKDDTWSWEVPCFREENVDGVTFLEISHE